MSFFLPTYNSHVYVSIGDVLDHSLAIVIEIEFDHSSHYENISVDNSNMYHTLNARIVMDKVYVKNNHNNCDPYELLLSIIRSDNFEVNHTTK